jgi:hypothetical protein
MARYNYFVGGFGDYYSEWHRNKCNDIAYIDIDSVPICINKPCWKPLAVIETVYDTGKNYKKYTNVVEAIAQGLNIPCFLLYYKPIPDTDSLEFKVQRLYPLKNGLKGTLEPILEEEWYYVMLKLQIEHDKVCKHKVKRG